MREMPIQDDEFNAFSKRNKVIFFSSKLIFPIAAIYSIFLPLKLGTIYFYIGLPIILMGLVGMIMVMMKWVNAPLEKLVINGFYRYSRHPMYISTFLVFLGISIAAASWIFVLF